MTDKDLTLLAFVVDRSGSMANIAADMNGGIRQLLADQSAVPGTVVVDITTFDTVVEHPYDWVRPDDVKADVVMPRGGTALNDALGETIVRLGERLAAMDEDDRPGKVIVVVITDGGENSSREYTTEQAKALVQKQIDEWQWEFLYLAANVDAFATGANYGFARGSTAGYTANSDGTQSMVAMASAGITRSRSGLATDFTDEEREAAVNG